jgi:hypothetical protein
MPLGFKKHAPYLPFIGAVCFGVPSARCEVSYLSNNFADNSGADFSQMHLRSVDPVAFLTALASSPLYFSFYPVFSSASGLGAGLYV